MFIASRVFPRTSLSRGIVAHRLPTTFSSIPRRLVTSVPVDKSWNERLQEQLRGTMTRDTHKRVLKDLLSFRLFTSIDPLQIVQLSKFGGHSPLTFTVAATCIGIYIASFRGKDLDTNFTSSKLWKGEWWRWFTCTITHSNIFHLLLNLSAWVPFARCIELQLGWLPLLYISLITGTLAVSSQVVTSDMIPAIFPHLYGTYWTPTLAYETPVQGLSGAVFGLATFGYFFNMAPRIFNRPRVFQDRINSMKNPRNEIHARILRREVFGPRRVTSPRNLAVMFGIGLALQYAGIPIANAAHFMGALGGGIMGTFWALRGPMTGVIAGGVFTGISVLEFYGIPFSTPKLNAFLGTTLFSQGKFLESSKYFEKMLPLKDQWSKIMYCLSLGYSGDPEKIQHAVRLSEEIDLNSVVGLQEWVQRNTKVQILQTLLQRYKLAQSQASTQQQEEFIVRRMYLQDQLKAMKSENPFFYSRLPWYCLNEVNAVDLFKLAFGKETSHAPTTFQVENDAYLTWASFLKLENRIDSYVAKSIVQNPPADI
eukprot:TRINITY_DN9957_c0_g2_i1.p1 TRINITY_DN9957_c0_g2~~TRINITY_DN9957_c0_g2_i1.p1  ORF type:complete len:538 (+),score=145.34 TRINITY_DN9957_c0_g2_i1:76-1689(+)